MHASAAQEPPWLEHLVFMIYSKPRMTRLYRVDTNLADVGLFMDLLQWIRLRVAVYLQWQLELLYAIQLTVLQSSEGFGRCNKQTFMLLTHT